jgi:hypothetical protein
VGAALGVTQAPTHIEHDRWRGLPESLAQLGSADEDVRPGVALAVVEVAHGVWRQAV